jgi:hypothetical protein
LDVLQTPCLTHLVPHLVKGGKNSNYSGRGIDLDDVGVWDNFVTVDEVEALWEHDLDLMTIIKKALTDDSIDCYTLVDPLLFKRKVRNKMDFE